MKEPDQLEPVPALRPGLVPVDLGKPRTDGGVRGDESVDVGEPEEPPHAVHHRGDRGVHQPGVAELTYVDLNMRTLNPHKRIQPIALAPAEPTLQLVGVQVVCMTRVPRQVGDRGKLPRRHRGWLERQPQALCVDQDRRPDPRLTRPTYPADWKFRTL